MKSAKTARSRSEGAARRALRLSRQKHSRGQRMKQILREQWTAFLTPSDQGPRR